MVSNKMDPVWRRTCGLADVRINNKAMTAIIPSSHCHRVSDGRRHGDTHIGPHDAMAMGESNCITILDVDNMLGR